MTHFAHGWDPAISPLVVRSGVAGVRDELYWREVEPERGRFAVPAHYENTMATLARHRLSPLIVLSFENDHYDGGATPHSDEAIAAFARYAVAVVQRYVRDQGSVGTNSRSRSRPAPLSPETTSGCSRDFRVKRRPMSSWCERRPVACLMKTAARD